VSSEHNAIKYDFDLLKMLSRLGAVGEEEQGVTRFSETLQPIVDWRNQLEQYFPANRALCSGVVIGIAAGGAGTRSILLLDNSTVDVIAIATMVMFSGIAQDMFLGWFVTGLGTDSGNAMLRDFRRQRDAVLGGAGRARLTLRSRNNAALATLGTFNLVNGAQLAHPPRQPISVVIPPGVALGLFPGTDNVALGSVGFEWEERKMTPGEPK